MRPKTDQEWLDTINPITRKEPSVPFEEKYRPMILRCDICGWKQAAMVHYQAREEEYKWISERMMKNHPCPMPMNKQLESEPE